VNVNQAAFLTTTTLGVATIAATVSAVATTAGTVALVAYSILAISTAGLSISAITAWVAVKGDDRDDDNCRTYFKTFVTHSGFALAGFFQFTAQTLVQAVINGLGKGIKRGIERRVGGADITYENVTLRKAQ
jgi:hypothetical protein